MAFKHHGPSAFGQCVVADALNRCRSSVLVANMRAVATRASGAPTRSTGVQYDPSVPVDTHWLLLRISTRAVEWWLARRDLSTASTARISEWGSLALTYSAGRSAHSINGRQTLRARRTWGATSLCVDRCWDGMDNATDATHGDSSLEGPVARLPLERVPTATVR